MILVVDDEPDVRKLVRSILENSGYEAAEAASPDEALRLVQEQAPEILVTDIVMPGMSGLALAAHAIRLNPALGVVFMSGFAAQYERELTGSICLRKPFSIKELLAAIADVHQNQHLKPPGASL